MIKNYLTVAIRNIARNKTFSAINILGLAIGMACCILILLYVQHEMSYDQHHEHAHRIYRIAVEGKIAGTMRQYAVTPLPMGPALVKDYPEVIEAMRFSRAEPKTLVEDQHGHFFYQYFGQFFCERLKKIIDKKVPFTQIGCQRFSESKTIQTSETAQWNWQKRYSIGSTFANPKKSFSSPFLPPYSLHEAKSIFATFHAIPITVSAHTPVNLTNPLTLWGSTVPSSMNV